MLILQLKEINSIEKQVKIQNYLINYGGPGVISCWKDSKAKIKKDAEGQFAQQAVKILKWCYWVFNWKYKNLIGPAEFLKMDSKCRRNSFNCRASWRSM